MRLGQLLELLGRHVLAPSSDGVGQPALEVEVPALVQVAAVTGVVPKPSPRPERPCGASDTPRHESVRLVGPYRDLAGAPRRKTLAARRQDGQLVALGRLATGARRLRVARHAAHREPDVGRSVAIDEGTAE